MSTTRVLHVIARMNVGGTARYLGELLEHFPGSVLATGYVQNAERESLADTPFPIYRINHLGRRISLLNDFRAWIELRSLVHKLKPEIIHTHTFKAGLIGRLIGGSHKRIHTFHGHLFDDNSFSKVSKKIILGVERILAKRTDILVSVGKKVGSDLRALKVAPNGYWTSIPPGIRSLPKIEKLEARKLLGLESEIFLVGWMARMAPVKNPLLALSVARQMPEIQFVMAGGGELLEDVKKSAPKNVSVIGWTNASLFWSAVDCGLSTSDNEGIPIALIEAQMAGIPVVATNVGSVCEVIEDGITGFVSSQTVASLVEALEKIRTDAKLRSQMTESAIYRANRNFILSKMLGQYSKIYDLVLED